MKRAAVISAIVVAALVTAPPARADEIVGVLQLETEGVSETAAEKFESSIEEGLAGTGFQVSPRHRLREALANSSYIDGCHFGPCLNEVYRNTKVKLVLVGRIVGLGPAYSFVVSLVDTRSGVPISQVADICDVCTLEEAIATATLAVIELVINSGSIAKADAASAPRPLAPDKLKRQLDLAKKRGKKHKEMVRRAALFFIGAAVVAGGAGAYFLSKDEDSKGYAAVAGAGASAVTGLTFLVISGRY